MNSTINFTSSDEKYINSIENFTDNGSMAIFVGGNTFQMNSYLSGDKNAFAQIEQMRNKIIELKSRNSSKNNKKLRTKIGNTSIQDKK